MKEGYPATRPATVGDELRRQASAGEPLEDLAIAFQYGACLLNTMLPLYNVCVVVPWEVEYTHEFEAWWETLNEEVQEAIDAAVELLEERGPALGRPLADNVHQSRHPNMKELRPAQTIRVLFAFDPRRAALLLIGGDKRGSWNRWYDEMVPVADALYDEHLAEVGEPKERRE